jgi:pyruvate,water dikinase
MKDALPLAEVRDRSIFGSKAVGLGDATRAGIPVPPGVALSGSIVESVAAGDEHAIGHVERAVRDLKGPFAVRSSAVDEDGPEASFAGQHLTMLNVPSASTLSSALRDVRSSAHSDAAVTYRRRLGLLTRPIVGAIVQELVNSHVAGVMFTKHPISGEDERVIEASWGLGTAVVAGLVIPDHYRIARSGEVLERRPGRKRVAIRTLLGGGSVEQEVTGELSEQLCLDDHQLTQLEQLASRCEETSGPALDIEWAFADGQIYLLQCRAVTRA